MKKDFQEKYDLVKGLYRWSINVFVMGQAEVLEFFETHPSKWYTSLDIRQHIGGTLSSVNVALKKLREFGLVEYKQIRNPQKSYLYRFKE